MVCLKEYLELVTFQHTLFALPFAYLGILLGARRIADWTVWFWVTLIMISARTFGMGINRLIDQELDAQNPRTANRALPAGRLKRYQVRGLIMISAIAVIIACAALNQTTLLLSPVALVVMGSYSYLKRFTWLSHFVLGVILGCAPVLGWLAASGKIASDAILLGCAVLFWVAGFDIIYATLDVEFDQHHLLWSIPSYLGIRFGLFISKICHCVTLFFLGLVGWNMGLGVWYWTGFLIAAGLLYYQHRIVIPEDLSRVNRAFFVANGWLSVVLFLMTLLDVVF